VVERRSDSQMETFPAAFSITMRLTELSVSWENCLDLTMLLVRKKKRPPIRIKVMDQPKGHNGRSP